MIQMRQCRTCGREKRPDAFYGEGRRKATQCKKCANRAVTERRRREAQQGAIVLESPAAIWATRGMS